jgi:rare lipoprotein A
MNIKLGSIIMVITLFFVISFPSHNIANAEDVSFFEDVSTDAPYYDAVKYMFDKSIIKGKDDGLFHPDDEITRVEALKIVISVRTLHVQQTFPGADLFPDVTDDKWYSNYVYTAKRNHIISGDENGNFNPDSNISRAESCKLVMGTFGVKLHHIHESYSDFVEYDDVSSDVWYSPCVGLTSYYSFFKPSGESFYPDRPITRAEFARFAYKLSLFSETGGLNSLKPYNDINSEDGEEQDLEESNLDEITDETENTEIITTETDEEIVPDENSEEDFFEETDKDNIIPEEFVPGMELLTKGVASYYGNEFNGRGTASGAKFDNDKFMAAHPLLPFNSRVRVTNIENGEFVDVDVLDCGPFVSGRIIDLSKAAFDQIGHLGSGLLDVELEILELGPNKWQRTCFDLTQSRW